MDTAKAANLFSHYPKADLYEFINAPIGRGTPIEKKLSPLIASKSGLPHRTSQRTARAAHATME
jgi:hypothetical protein